MSSFVEHLLHFPQPLRNVEARRMFGGQGLYSGDVIFAIVADGTPYLEVDAEIRPLFESMALEPFTYRRKQNLVTARSLHTVPAESFDDPGAHCRWAKTSIEAAASAKGRAQSPHDIAPDREEGLAERAD